MVAWTSAAACQGGFHNLPGLLNFLELRQDGSFGTHGHCRCYCAEGAWVGMGNRFKLELERGPVRRLMDWSYLQLWHHSSHCHNTVSLCMRAAVAGKGGKGVVTASSELA
jgi:hypothetical protein